MIAQLTLSMGQRRVVATLEDDFSWQCDDDLLTHSYLNSVFGPDKASRMGGPALARSAAAAVQEAGWRVEAHIAPASSEKQHVA